MTLMTKSECSVHYRRKKFNLNKFLIDDNVDCIIMYSWRVRDMSNFIHDIRLILFYADKGIHIINIDIPIHYMVS